MNKIIIQFIFLFNILSLSLISCSREALITQEEIFLSNNSDLAPFIELLPISIKAERIALETNLFEIQFTLERIKNKRKSDAELIKFIDDIANEISTNMNCKIEEFHKYEKEMQHGDSAFHFSFRNDKKSENGILILNQGEVKKKLVFRSVNFGKLKKSIGKKKSLKEKTSDKQPKCVDLFTLE